MKSLTSSALEQLKQEGTLNKELAQIKSIQEKCEQMTGFLSMNMQI